MCRTSTDPKDHNNNKYCADLGSTPLHFAVMNNKFFVMVQHILESGYGIDPDVENHNGKTPLLIATQLGLIKISKYLIEKHRCNLSHREERFRTVLHVAAHEGRLAMLKYLINHQHCDPNAEDDAGRIPFHIALICG